MQHLPKSLRRTSLCLSAALALVLLSGCEVEPYAGHVSEQYPDTYVELEPNDTAWFPDFVAVVDGASFLTVDGHVEAFVGDVVDHIEFESAEPIEIDFFLEAHGVYGDVDVSIYDPIADVVLATYAIDGPVESGTIIIHDPGRPFQFVIEAYADDSAWTLELVCYPHICNCLTAPQGGPDGDGEPIEDEDVFRDETLEALEADSLGIVIRS